MKILRVIPSMDPKQGGPCQGIRNSIPEMKKLGVENEVVCMDAQDSEYLGKDDFTIHAVGQARGPWAYTKQLIPWLLSNFNKFDVVIIHGLWLYHGYATYKAWRKYKRFNQKYPKLYVMPHGMLDPYFQKAEGRKLKAIRNWIYWKLIEGKILNNVEGILFTCEEELLLARETFSPYSPKKELNVGYGINEPPFFMERMKDLFNNNCRRWDEKPFILFLSRIHEKKGVDMLVKAYIRLQSENKVLPQLIIAGPGLDTTYGEMIKRMSAGNENIIFPGMLSGDIKWGAFYNCEVFILPSHQENFGIAIVEAMACKKAVLISDKVNIWREIEKGNAGFISNDTENDIYQLLKNWLNLSTNNKIEMGENAFNVYKKYFSIEKSTKTLLIALNE